MYHTNKATPSQGHMQYLMYWFSKETTTVLCYERNSSTQNLVLGLYLITELQK